MTNEKKGFSLPEIEIIQFDNDVISTSDPFQIPGGGSGEWDE